MKKLFLALTVGVAAVFVSLAVALGAVSNGSLETGTNPGAGFIPLAPGSTAITGWTISGNSIDYIGSYWQASNGTRSIDLTGFSGPGATVSQSLATTPGHTYKVSFDLAGNPEGPPAVKTLVVSAGSVINMPFTFDVTGKTKAAMGWTPKSFNFTAAAASTTLAFTSTTGGPAGLCCFGPALDNVQVVSLTPVSDDQCKQGGWEALFDDQGNQFKNQGDCVSYVSTKGRNPGAITP